MGKQLLTTSPVLHRNPRKFETFPLRITGLKFSDNSCQPFTVERFCIDILVNFKIFPFRITGLKFSVMI